MQKFNSKLCTTDSRSVVIRLEFNNEVWLGREGIVCMHARLCALVCVCLCYWITVHLTDSYPKHGVKVYWQYFFSLLQAQHPMLVNPKFLHTVIVSKPTSSNSQFLFWFSKTGENRLHAQYLVPYLDACIDVRVFPSDWTLHTPSSTLIVLWSARTVFWKIPRLATRLTNRSAIIARPLPRVTDIEDTIWVGSVLWFSVQATTTVVSWICLCEIYLLGESIFLKTGGTPFVCV